MTREILGYTKTRVLCLELDGQPTPAPEREVTAAPFRRASLESSSDEVSRPPERDVTAAAFRRPRN